jgi:hypothetical protein
LRKASARSTAFWVSSLAKACTASELYDAADPVDT